MLDIPVLTRTPKSSNMRADSGWMMGKDPHSIAWACCWWVCPPHPEEKRGFRGARTCQRAGCIRFRKGNASWNQRSLGWNNKSNSSSSSNSIALNGLSLSLLFAVALMHFWCERAAAAAAAAIRFLWNCYGDWKVKVLIVVQLAFTSSSSLPGARLLWLLLLPLLHHHQLRRRRRVLLAYPCQPGFPI